MIKNIIFDMGNVLLDYNPDVSLDAYCNSKEERDILKKELFEGPEWVQGDLGYMSESERYDIVKERVDKKYWDTLKKCAEGWDICMTPLDGAREFCDYVKDKGYGIYVLSNASDKFYDYFPRLAPLEYFDGILVSADVHMIKPDIKIYECFIDKFKVNPEECLFIDDRLANIEGAAKSGINGVVFNNDFEKIKTQFNL